MRHVSGMNPDKPLVERLWQRLVGSSSLDMAVAYAKTSGVAEIVTALPARTRAVIGLGFGVSDPEAVERLSAAGAEVRVVVDSPTFSASTFHPKLYLVHSGGELSVFSGSGNLTAGGLRDNFEQYEELVFGSNTAAAQKQAERFERFWAAGKALSEVQASGEWAAYIAAAEARREFERKLRRVTPRRRARTSVGKGRLPGWVGLTQSVWWDNQRALRDKRGPVFMRGDGAGRFKRLESGGLFFYLVTRAVDAEEDRGIEGFSEYRDDFEFSTAAESWRRFGPRVGYPTRPEYVGNSPDVKLGLIILEPVRELNHRVTVRELRANGVPFDRALQQGRGLTGDELATVLRLANGYR